jgi:hypothetical protein
MTTEAMTHPSLTLTWRNRKLMLNGVCVAEARSKGRNHGEHNRRCQMEVA